MTDQFLLSSSVCGRPYATTAFSESGTSHPWVLGVELASCHLPDAQKFWDSTYIFDKCLCPRSKPWACIEHPCASTRPTNSWESQRSTSHCNPLHLLCCSINWTNKCICSQVITTSQERVSSSRSSEHVVCGPAFLITCLLYVFSAWKLHHVCSPVQDGPNTLNRDYWSLFLVTNVFLYRDRNYWHWLRSFQLTLTATCTGKIQPSPCLWPVTDEIQAFFACQIIQLR